MNDNGNELTGGGFKVEITHHQPWMELPHLYPDEERVLRWTPYIFELRQRMEDMERALREVMALADRCVEDSGLPNDLHAQPPYEPSGRDFVMLNDVCGLSLTPKDVTNIWNVMRLWPYHTRMSQMAAESAAVWKARAEDLQNIINIERARRAVSLDELRDWLAYAIDKHESERPPAMRVPEFAEWMLEGTHERFKRYADVVIAVLKNKGLL